MSVPRDSQSGDRRSQREPALDLLRGFFLVLMTVDHLDGFLARYGFELFGFAAAAEGFAILSGLVAARVYGRLRAHDEGKFWRAIRQRVALLYASHAILVLLVSGIVWLRTGPPLAADPYAPFATQPAVHLVKALTMTFQPYLLDVLPMYVLFVSILPVLLWALSRRRWLTIVVSLLVWSLSLLVDSETWIEGSGLFVFPSWQLLFVLGAALGTSESPVDWSSRLAKTALFVAVGMIALGLIFKHGWFGATGPLDDSWLTTRPKLGPLRVLTVLAYVVVIAWGHHTGFGRVRVSWLEFLGRHSLYVFVWHFPLVLFCKPTRVVEILEAGFHVHVGSITGTLVDTGLTMLGVASLTLPAWLHARWRKSMAVAK